MQYKTFHNQTRRSRGFTLIELLISMGLVMIVTLGVNQVFSMATNTIGMGNRVNEMSRDSRAAVSSLQQDLSRWATDSPIFYIQNQYIPSPDGMRRVDTIGFFSRGDYRRVTADNRKIYSPTRSTEAWTWIGHTVLTDPFPRSPLTSPSPTNTLGREVILLKDPNIMLMNSSGAPLETFYERNFINLPDNSTQRLPNLSPLNAYSLSNAGPWATTYFNVTSSRYDLAGTTIEQFRADLAELDPDFTQITNWWNKYKLIYRFQCVPTYPQTSFTDFKHVVYPVLTSENLAKSTPAMMNNCSDFIIDFSGDYVTQDPDGAIKSYQPDGVIDFIYDKNTGARSTQWYGLSANDSNVDPNVKPLLISLKNGKPLDNPYYFIRENLNNNNTLTNTHLWVNGRGLPKNVRISFRQTDPEGRIQVGPWTQFTAGPR